VKATLAALVMVAGFLVVAASPSRASVGDDWRMEIPAGSPAARSSLAMVYDEVRKEVVLFGGATSPVGGPLGDTWVWDGAAWSPRTPLTSPPARKGASMVYDKARQRVLLFGGEGIQFRNLNDTWSWTGTTWEQLNTAQGAVTPPTRANASMAYDDARQQVVLHDGLQGSGDAADTWIWDGSTWRQVNTGPGALTPRQRRFASMAYDAARQRTVLFGGSIVGGVAADTWLWDGTGWSQVNTAAGAPTPPGRSGHVMAFAPGGGGRVILFGGIDPDKNDTWEWNGTGWGEQTPATRPSARGGAGMAYDAARQRAVLFGGWNSLLVPMGDTWTYGGSAPPKPLADFDGDARTDISVFRPSTGTWYLRPSAGGPASATDWGTSGDLPVPGDYDGDGKTDLAVFRPSTGTWFLRPSAGGPDSATDWGTSGDLPVPGDYDGDGKADLAVFRPSTGTWFLRPSAGGPDSATAWGTSGDLPVPGDYDGDGNADLAVFRPSTGTWFLRPSAGGPASAADWGASGDIPTPGDYDGDGKADLAVFRPGNGTWYLRPSAAGPASATTWGTNGDMPVPGDYDADGKSDLAVFRPGNGTWYVNGGAATAWGTTGDHPLPLPAAIRQAFFQ